MADPSKTPNLKVLAGPKAGERYDFDPVDNVLIGSDPSCPFFIDGPGISPIHARVWVDAEGATVFDTHSSRGVYVNDDRVNEKAPLHHGDILWLGSPGDDGSVMIQVSLPPRKEAAVAISLAPEEESEAEISASEQRETAAEPEGAWETVAPEATPEDALERLEVIEADEVLAAFEGSALSEGPAASDALEGEGSLEASAPPVFVEAPAPASVFAPRAPAAEELEGFELAPPELSEPTPIEAPGPPAAFAEAPAPAYGEEPAVPVSEEFEGFEVALSELSEPAAIESPVSSPIPFALLEEPSASPPQALVEDFVVDEPLVATAPPVPAPPPPEPPPPVVARPVPQEPPPAEKAAAAEPSDELPAKPPPETPLKTATSPPRPLLATRPTPQRPAASGPRVGVYVGLGVAVLALLAAGVWYFIRLTPPPAPPPQAAVVATTLPPPETVPPEPPAESPSAQPAPVEEIVTVATPAPAATRVPLAAAPAPPLTTTPRPAPTPVARPVASPPVATATAPAVTAPAQPSQAPPAPQGAAQISGLLGQAESALAARKPEQAAGLFDEVLKLDPQNAKATAGKAAAAVAAASLKKTFAVGKTSFTGKAKKGPAGFDDNEPADADYTGRIDFEFNPQHVKPGDTLDVRIFLVNEGKKPIKVSAMTLTTIANGQRTTGTTNPAAKEVAPGQRALMGAAPNAWQEGTSSWTLDVLINSARSETYASRVTWR